MQVPFKTSSESRIDTSIQSYGKFEVTPDQTFSFEIILKQHKGRWIILDKDVAGSEIHKVTFRIWSYDEMIDLRKRALIYDSVKRIHSIDNDLLNRLKIQKLLVNWTFDKDNPRLKLIHVNGVLVDESWMAFTRLSPNISERIINEMNLVLDYGG